MGRPKKILTIHNDEYNHVYKKLKNKKKLTTLVLGYVSGSVNKKQFIIESDKEYIVNNFEMLTTLKILDKIRKRKMRTGFMLSKRVRDKIKENKTNE